MKYLYSFSIKGIQEFIFASNELKDIEGASEIIKKINYEFEKNYQDKCSILLNAAGNIKAVFDKKEDLEEVLTTFYKNVISNGYGLLATQAALKIKGDFPNKEEFAKIENLLHSKRNRPNIALDRYLSIMDISPKSARPVFKYEKNIPFDKAKYQKHTAFQKQNSEDEKNIEKLANEKGKIAIIHADGNSLGKVVAGLGKDISVFSKQLDEATKKSFRNAIKKVLKDNKKKYREVILGGDDMTVIMDANYALEFTNEFLKNFEKETKGIKGLGDKYLSACAGIAIVNKKYPFYYGVELAEVLCSIAKKESKAKNKNTPPSSLIFYNLQSGNFVDFDEIRNNELKINNIDLMYGPYYINENPKVDDFIEIIDILRTSNSPASKLREWLKILEISEESSQIYLDRIYEMAKSKWDKLDEFEEKLKKFDENLSLNNLIINNKTPIYEVLEIISNTTKDEK